MSESADRLKTQPGSLIRVFELGDRVEDAQGKPVPGRGKSTIIDIVIRPGEAGILEPDYAPIKV